MVQKEGEASLPSDAPSPLLLGDCPVLPCLRMLSPCLLQHSQESLIFAILLFSVPLPEALHRLVSNSRMPSQSVLFLPFLIAAELTWMPSFDCSPPGSSPLPYPCVSCSESATVQLMTMARLLSLSRL